MHYYTLTLEGALLLKLKLLRVERVLPENDVR